MFEKNLILLRGLPGAGKSSLAKILSENGKYPIFSIDDYFTNPQTGVYSFNFSENHLAYKQCISNTENAMQNQVLKIFIHNTFTLDWELEPYFELAKNNNYTIHVITVEKYHNNRNIHEVSELQLEKMAEKYKVKLL
jgi:predicted kinase